MAQPRKAFHPKPADNQIRVGDVVVGHVTEIRRNQDTRKLSKTPAGYAYAKVIRISPKGRLTIKPIEPPREYPIPSNLKNDLRWWRATLGSRQGCTIQVDRYANPFHYYACRFNKLQDDNCHVLSCRDFQWPYYCRR